VKEGNEVVEEIAVGELIGHMLAAAVAREDGNGASGTAGPAMRARRRSRNWQVAAWASKNEERNTSVQSVQTERPLEVRSGGPEGGHRRAWSR
jgi:hypothetical protein